MELGSPIATLVIIFDHYNSKIVKQLLSRLRDINIKCLYISLISSGKENIENYNTIKTCINNVIVGYEYDTIISEHLSQSNVIADSITWFFKNESEGIIIDNMIIPSNKFFDFCSILLSKYRDNEVIGGISGQPHSFNVVNSHKTTYYFSALPLTGCWATWKRAWDHITSDVQQASELIKRDFLDKKPSIHPFKYHYYNIFNYLSSDSPYIWKYHYMFHCFFRNKLSIIPNKNFIQNLKKTKKSDENSMNIFHPELIECDYIQDIKIQEQQFQVQVITQNVPNGYNYIKSQLTEWTNKNSNQILIPKIIHQIYENPDGPPEFLIQMSKSWKRNNPDWDYTFWDKKAMDAFLEIHYPEFITLFGNYAYPVQKWDAIRYLILHKYGGLYVDMDYECLEPISPLLLRKTCCIGIEPTVNALKYRKQMILSNAFMASVPSHPFINTLTANVISNAGRKFSDHPGIQIMESTGPFMLTKTYEAYKNKNDVTLIPADLIAPFTMEEIKMFMKKQLDNNIITDRVNKAFAIHYFLGSWVKQTK